MVDGNQTEKRESPEEEKSEICLGGRRAGKRKKEVYDTL